MLGQLGTTLESLICKTQRGFNIALAAPFQHLVNVSPAMGFGSCFVLEQLQTHGSMFGWTEALSSVCGREG